MGHYQKNKNSSKCYYKSSEFFAVGALVMHWDAFLIEEFQGPAKRRMILYYCLSPRPTLSLYFSN